MTYLSPHFSLAELTTTQQRRFNNDPPDWVIENLTHTAEQMERVRAVLGKPVHVNSGYRSPSVNKAVGGSPTSAHVQGHAVDFISPGFGDPLAICKTIIASGIEFDQLIEELGRWVHISFDPRMRGQVKTYLGNGHYRAGL